MNPFWVVTGWEFYRHFRSRSFLMATFVSPLLFGLFILIPALLVENSEPGGINVIGCVSMDTLGFCDKISGYLQQEASTGGQPDIRLLPILPDTSEDWRRRWSDLFMQKKAVDSLEGAYASIKQRRSYVFQKPETSSREALLKHTYNELIQARDDWEGARIAYEDNRRQQDSLWMRQLLGKADFMLQKGMLEGYFIIPADLLSGGAVEIYSLLPNNFLQFAPIRRAVEETVIEARLRQEGLEGGQIEQWLRPVEFRQIQQQGEKREEFNIMLSYLGPVIVVLFLFISIFTSSGFLFSGMIQEKTSRVMEILLSSVNHLQLVAGKIFGLGLLGIFQILIWYGMTWLLVGLDLVNAGEIGFLTVGNALLFLLYFVLGYLFFASVFVGIGSLFSSQEDAHHLSQFMRLLSIFPILLAFLVLEFPDSLLVRLLSFVPPLTPTFMILRTPLGHPPLLDYLISVLVMIVSIAVSVFLAGRLFKIGSLSYGGGWGFRRIYRVLLGRE
ncbi:MAG: ABC transporter permease [Calditrichia bacterium]